MAGRMISGAAALAELVRAAGENDAPGVHRVLPVVPELSGLLPGRGLRRGSTVAVAAGRAAPVGGSTSLLLALLAEASRSGSWCAVVGLPSLGALAAQESGIALERLALVPDPGPDWPTVIAALIDGVDVVVAAVPGQVAPTIADRLVARARQRGSVLMPFGQWPGADVTLQVTAARWEGLSAGRGRLRRREVTILARGRGAAARPKEVTLWMPGVTLNPPTLPPPSTSVPSPSLSRTDPFPSPPVAVPNPGLSSVPSASTHPAARPALRPLAPPAHPMLRPLAHSTHPEPGQPVHSTRPAVRPALGRLAPSVRPALHPLARAARPAPGRLARFVRPAAHPAARPAPGRLARSVRPSARSALGPSVCLGLLSVARSVWPVGRAAHGPFVPSVYPGLHPVACSVWLAGGAALGSFASSGSPVVHLLARFARPVEQAAPLPNLAGIRSAAVGEWRPGAICVWVTVRAERDSVAPEMVTGARLLGAGGVRGSAVVLFAGNGARWSTARTGAPARWAVRRTPSEGGAVIWLRWGARTDVVARGRASSVEAEGRSRGRRPGSAFAV